MQRRPRSSNIFPSDSSGRPASAGGHFVRSLDPSYLRFTEMLVRRLNDDLKVEVTDSGHAGPNGVPGDFSASLSVTGCGMNPIPLPLTDNTDLLARAGLATELRSQDKPYFDAVMDALFGFAAATDLRIDKEATTAAPLYTRDVQYKKTQFLKLAWNVDEVLRLATSSRRSDLLRLLEEYDSVMMYTIYTRSQPDVWKDGVPKPRLAATEHEARSGRFEGRTLADKRVFDDFGREVPGHAAMRIRSVFAFCGPLNYLESAVVSCFKTVFSARFAFTYHTTTAANKEEKLGRFKYVVGSDVKTMDVLVPRWFIDYFHDRLHLYLRGDLVEFMRRAFHAPWIAANPWYRTPETYNPCFGADPFGPNDFDMNPGLPSGIAINPIFGKAWMTCVAVSALKDIGVIQRPHDVVTFLSGDLNKGTDLHTGMLDSADDMVFATNSAEYAAAFREIKSPYALFEPETPVTYLGDVLSWSEGRLRAFPNPQTYLSNMLARERGIDDPRAWATGTLLRNQLYSAMPTFRHVQGVFEDLAVRYLGVNPRVIAERIGIHQSLNDVDALVSLNPSVIHYKINPEEVSPEVLDRTVATVPAQDWFYSLRPLFKVPIQNASEFRDSQPSRLAA